jgi:hypothetical protein
MPISDPLLLRKLNNFGQEFGLFAMRQAEAAAMRASQENRGLSPYIWIFQNAQETHRQFFDGYQDGGRTVDGFHKIVIDYFTTFPANLHNDLFQELNEHLEAQKVAWKNWGRHKINRVAREESEESGVRAMDMMESGVESEVTTERNRLFIKLREIQQARRVTEFQQDEPTRLDKVKKWASNNPILVFVFCSISVVGFIVGFIEGTKKIGCEAFHVLCESKDGSRDKNP